MFCLGRATLFVFILYTELPGFQGKYIKVPDLPDVCQRCRYRYAGIKDSRQYDQKNLKPVLISSNADDVCPAKKMKLEVSRCPACLGVLQEEFMAQELEKVIIVGMEISRNYCRVWIDKDSLPAILRYR